MRDAIMIIVGLVLLFVSGLWIGCGHGQAVGYRAGAADAAEASQAAIDEANARAEDADTAYLIQADSLAIATLRSDRLDLALRASEADRAALLNDLAGYQARKAAALTALRDARTAADTARAAVGLASALRDCTYLRSAAESSLGLCMDALEACNVRSATALRMVETCRDGNEALRAANAGLQGQVSALRVAQRSPSTSRGGAAGTSRDKRFASSRFAVGGGLRWAVGSDGTRRSVPVASVLYRVPLPLLPNPTLVLTTDLRDTVTLTAHIGL